MAARLQAMTLLDRISRFLLFFGGVALVAMMLHVSADVLFKRVFGTPIQGTIEMVSSYYMVGCVFLALGIVQRDRRQIAVEFLTDAMSPRHRLIAEIFSALVMIVFAALLVWMGTEQAIKNTIARETNWSTVASFEIWPTRWFPVLGYGAMLAYLVVQTISDVRALLTGSEDESR